MDRGASATQSKDVYRITTMIFQRLHACHAFTIGYYHFGRQSLWTWMCFGG